MRIIALTIFCLLAVGTSAAQESFTFQPQQSVYIVAVRGNIGDPSMSTLDLAAEKGIREGFEKRATFPCCALALESRLRFLMHN